MDRIDNECAMNARPTHHTLLAPLRCCGAAHHMIAPSELSQRSGLQTSRKQCTYPNIGCRSTNQLRPATSRSCSVRFTHCPTWCHVVVGDRACLGSDAGCKDLASPSARRTSTADSELRMPERSLHSEARMPGRTTTLCDLCETDEERGMRGIRGTPSALQTM